MTKMETLTIYDWHVDGRLNGSEVILSGDPSFAGGGDLAMECPLCGETYTHLNKVQVASAGGDSVTVEASGEDESAEVSVVRTKDQNPFGWQNFRRHGIALTIECEDGHTTEIVFIQHKGNTFVQRRVIEDMGD